MEAKFRRVNFSLSILCCSCYSIGLQSVILLYLLSLDSAPMMFLTNVYIIPTVPIYFSCFGYSLLSSPLTRVSTKRRKNLFCFGPKITETGSVSRLFQFSLKQMKILFRFVSVFRMYFETTKTNRFASK